MQPLSQMGPKGAGGGEEGGGLDPVVVVMGGQGPVCSSW